MNKGNAGKGRQVGSKNRTTAILKEAILEAAALCGEDGNGKGETVGYLKSLAVNHPPAFAQLLGKVLPLTLQGDPEKPLVMQHEVKPADRLKQMVIQVAERSGETGIALPN